jgi:hypothetical protein
MVSSKTGEGISQAFNDLASRMIFIANELIRQKLSSFVTPGLLHLSNGEV